MHGQKSSILSGILTTDYTDGHGLGTGIERSDGVWRLLGIETSF